MPQGPTGARSRGTGRSRVTGARTSSSHQKCKPLDRRGPRAQARRRAIRAARDPAARDTHDRLFGLLRTTFRHPGGPQPQVDAQREVESSPGGPDSLIPAGIARYQSPDDCMRTTGRLNLRRPARADERPRARRPGRRARHSGCCRDSALCRRTRDPASAGQPSRRVRCGCRLSPTTSATGSGQGYCPRSPGTMPPSNRFLDRQRHR